MGLVLFDVIVSNAVFPSPNAELDVDTPEAQSKSIMFTKKKVSSPKEKKIENENKNIYNSLHFKRGVRTVIICL